MITHHLKKKEHKFKIGNRCPHIEPNIKEDTILIEDDEVIGFYIKNLKGKSKELLKLIDIEFRSKKVPKSLLERSDVFDAVYRKGLTRKSAKATQTIQMSTILGSLLPKHHMRRPYPCVSAVHQREEAKNYIKAMIIASKECENYIKRYAPEIYKRQTKLVKENVPKKWRFGNIFTGSISNYNISAPFHKDGANLKGCINVILTTRNNATGGCLHVPEYDITMEMANNSMCVYPSWRTMHGVTPIQVNDDRSYRNTHIFYLLNGFQDYN